MVRKYEMDPKLTWEERYRKLEEHHIEETTALIEKVKLLQFQNTQMKEALEALKK